MGKQHPSTQEKEFVNSFVKEFNRTHGDAWVVKNNITFKDFECGRYVVHLTNVKDTFEINEEDYSLSLLVFFPTSKNKNYEIRYEIKKDNKKITPSTLFKKTNNNYYLELSLKKTFFENDDSPISFIISAWEKEFNNICRECFIALLVPPEVEDVSIIGIVKNICDHGFENKPEWLKNEFKLINDKLIFSTYYKGVVATSGPMSLLKIIDLNGSIEIKDKNFSINIFTQVFSSQIKDIIVTKQELIQKLDNSTMIKSTMLRSIEMAVLSFIEKTKNKKIKWILESANE